MNENLMRIAHIQHPYLPNYGYQENFLPAIQSEMGHSVKIFTSTEIPEKFRRDFGRDSFRKGDYSYKGVKTVRLKSIFKIDEIEDVALGGLSDALDEFDPEIIHSHGLVSPRTIQSYIYSKINDVPMVIDTHIDNGNFNLDGFSKKHIFGLYKNTFLRLLSREGVSFISVNAHARKLLGEMAFIPDNQIEFLPLGVSRDRFRHNPEEGANLRERMNIPEDECLIIFAGNIEPTKNLETLFRSLSGQSVNITLLLIGSVTQNYKEELISKASRLNLESKIQFHARVPHSDLSKYFNAADFGVWPGKLGISCIEAIGCGLPIVVPEDEAMKYLVSADNGLTFPQGDVESLRNCLKRYIDNPDLVNSHRINAIQFAKSELYWRNIAEKSISIYSGNNA